MARRKRRRAKNGRIMKSITGAVQWTVRTTIRFFPLVVVVGMVTGAFLGVRQVLYADPQLQVSRISVAPQEALTFSQRSSLEDQLVGTPLSDVAARVGQFYRETGIESPGVTPHDFSVALRGGG